MADIDIVVGAQDRATKILSDVEKSTKQLTRSVNTMGEKTNQSANVMQISFKSMAAGAAVIGGLVAAAKGISAAFSGMHASVEAFNTQEEAARGMTQAQLDFASALQVSTNVGDEATLALMRQAKLMGVQEDNLEQVATAATGLAEALGTSTTDALKKVNQAINGNANSLQRFLPEIRNAKTEQEKLAIVSEAAAGGLAKLQEDAGSTAGVMERAQGAFGDLSEKIGALFAPLYKIVYQGFAVFAETLQTALMPAIDGVNGGFDSMKPVMEAVMQIVQGAAVIIGSVTAKVIEWVSSIASYFSGAAETIVRAISFIEVVYQNFGQLIQLGTDAVMLKIEGMRADFEHVFVKVIPAHIIWFAQNFTNILSDMGEAALTIVRNLASKLSEAFQLMMEFVKSGFQGGMSGLMSDMGDAMAGSLLDGFEAKTRSLPEIAARGLTDTEKYLKQDMARIGTNVADAFQSKVSERMGMLGNLTAGEFDFSGLEGGDGPLAGLSKSVSQLKANESRLMTRGDSTDPLTDLVGQGKKQTKVLESIDKRMAESDKPKASDQGNVLQVELI